MSEYAAFIEGAGFTVTATDKSKWFTDILNMELERLSEMKSSFLECHSEKDYKDIEDGWNIKLVRVREGTQQWCVFEGVKPSA